MRSHVSGAQGSLLWDAVEPRLSVRESVLGAEVLAAKGPQTNPDPPPPGCPGLSHGFKDGPKVPEEAELGSELSSRVTQCLSCARP